MRRTATPAAETALTTTRPRRGRPPSGRAGEVDARILDAASTLFLARGFEGTSCDQVAALARQDREQVQRIAIPRPQLQHPAVQPLRHHPFAARVALGGIRQQFVSRCLRQTLPLRDAGPA